MRPEAEAYVGSYVRAIHDFSSDIAGEVCLTKGDVFQVTQVIDKNWLHGKNREKEGNFPADFVEKLQLQLNDDAQKVFVAIENFSAQQDCDLEITKGDIIYGLCPIDEFWWQGHVGTKEGIFPLTHVTELEMSVLLQARSKSVHSTEPLFAQALVDSKAQLDDELSFLMGDIITVTDIIDEDWYVGECRGKSGMFLASCVQLLNEDECNASTEKPRAQSEPNSSDTSDSMYPSRNKVFHVNTEQESIQISHEKHTLAYRHDDTVRTVPYTSENTKAHNDLDTGVTPYARTLFSFIGESPDQISFNANDIVTLIQHVDEQWIEGEIDGKIGLFPASYVEIVVDCPYAFSIEKTETLQAYSVSNNLEPSLTMENSGALNIVDNAHDTQSNHSFAKNGYDFKPTDQIDKQYAVVLYSFQAETDQDITVNEGDTVTVIKNVDDNWLIVRNDVGRTGMCPCSFVEIINAYKPKTNDVEIVIKDSDAESNVEMLPEKIVVCKNITFPGMYSKKEDQYVSVTNDIPSGSAKVTQKSDSAKSTSKPHLHPKPSLLPKPSLKPKPTPSPKPLPKFNEVTFSSLPTTGIPKSSSSKSLSMCASSENDSLVVRMSSLTKLHSHSMDEINNSDSDMASENNVTTCKESNSESGSSLDADGKVVNVVKKTSKDWDLSKPLDTIVQCELANAQHANKLRSNSVRSTSSLAYSQNIYEDISKVAVKSEKAPITPNYSRESFDIGGILFGNSMFFDIEVSGQERAPHLRKPSPPPGKIGGKEVELFSRPSFKKPAPQRPTGPKAAPVPSKMPILPTKSVSQTLPTHLDPTQSLQSNNMSRKLARPAPARPVRSPGRPQGNNLLGFSSINSSICIVGNELESEAVLELKSRISNLEKDLEDFKKSKAELEQMCQAVSGEQGDIEIQDNIQFYLDNISGITEELNTLKEQLVELCPKEKSKMEQEKLLEQQALEQARLKKEAKRKMEEQRAERMNRRMKVINELIQTEKDYLTSLSLIMEMFLVSTAEKHPDVNVEHLFGNMEEVAEISQKLLTTLEKATNCKDFTEQIIGTCFVSLAEDMKNVYAPYCRNHDDVITLVEKYSQNADIQSFLDRSLDRLRERHVVFDLEALLIKPVQRILKYPLLLNELYKTTDDDHIDKSEVMAAIKAMTDVAAAINEYKRRKDLVFKYKKDTDASLGDKLAKLNLHSIKKKSSRIKERFSVNLGFIDQTRDPNFDKEETRYCQLEKNVRLFLKNIQLYLEELKTMVNSQECIAADIADFFGENDNLPEVEKYQAFSNRIQITFLSNFQIEIDDLVIYPLSQLLQAIEGPNKVIQKRYDKLLDFDNLKRKAQNDKVFEKPMQIAKQDYEALNVQLLDDLPKMYTLALHLFRDCIGSFVLAQREFTDNIVKNMYSFLDLQYLTGEGIMESFNIKHLSIVDRLSLLIFMPKTFSPKVVDQKQDKKSKRMSLDPYMLRSAEVNIQTEGQKTIIMQQYTPQKLFRVTETAVAMDAMEISLCEGDIVGVIVEKDPMGNKERWFVDNGVLKGFVSKKVLIPLKLSSDGSQVIQTDLLGSSQTVINKSQQLYGEMNTAVSADVAADDMDFTVNKHIAPDIPKQTVHRGNDDTVSVFERDDDIELYFAEYPFSARNTNEVTLFEQQVVTVISKHDHLGNHEWWYVEADGIYGYVPAAYLRKMDSHGGVT